MASYVGVNTLPSAQESNVSAGADQDNFDEHSDSSALGEDVDEAGDLLSEVGAEDLDASLGSDMGSADSQDDCP